MIEEENEMPDLEVEDFVMILAKEINILSEAVTELATRALTAHQLDKFCNKLEKIRSKIDPEENEDENE